MYVVIGDVMGVVGDVQRCQSEMQVVMDCMCGGGHRGTLLHSMRAQEVMAQCVWCDVVVVKCSCCWGFSWCCWSPVSYSHIVSCVVMYGA